MTLCVHIKQFMEIESRCVKVTGDFKHRGISAVGLGWNPDLIFLHEQQHIQALWTKNKIRNYTGVVLKVYSQHFI